MLLDVFKITLIFNIQSGFVKMKSLESRSRTSSTEDIKLTKRARYESWQHPSFAISWSQVWLHGPQFEVPLGEVIQEQVPSQLWCSSGQSGVGGLLGQQEAAVAQEGQLSVTLQCGWGRLVLSVNNFRPILKSVPD